jgi:hypothetical protein
VQLLLAAGLLPDLCSLLAIFISGSSKLYIAERGGLSSYAVAEEAGTARELIMATKGLTRTYLVRGLDRILYSRPPVWPEGTFEQAVEDEGRLVLSKERINDASELALAIRAMDQQAERFRLAISRRTGCPLTLRLEKSDEPNFDPPGVASVRSTARFSDHAKGTVLPQDPPSEMDQLPEVAARWILTLVETRAFSDYPDEAIKRLQLLIEELLPMHGACLDAAQHGQVQEVRWVRDFVSHPVCDRSGVCTFIAANLPGAVIRNHPQLEVQFDRTNVEHRNFVGRWESIARGLVNPLLDAAIRSLP